jgi:hypothetical protein
LVTPGSVTRRRHYPSAAAKSCGKSTLVDPGTPFVAVLGSSQKDYGPVSNGTGAAGGIGLVRDLAAQEPTLFHPRGRSLRRTHRRRTGPMYVRILSLLGAIVATAANVAFVTPAAARTGESAAISYAGLDLANPADAARFDSRARRRV